MAKKSGTKRTQKSGGIQAFMSFGEWLAKEEKELKLAITLRKRQHILLSQNLERLRRDISNAAKGLEDIRNYRSGRK
jgi:hypothetical protein